MKAHLPSFLRSQPASGGAGKTPGSTPAGRASAKVHPDPSGLSAAPKSAQAEGARTFRAALPGKEASGKSSGSTGASARAWVSSMGHQVAALGHQVGKSTGSLAKATGRTIAKALDNPPPRQDVDLAYRAQGFTQAEIDTARYHGHEPVREAEPTPSSRETREAPAERRMPQAPKTYYRAPNDKEIAAAHAAADHYSTRADVPDKVPDEERNAKAQAEYKQALLQFNPAWGQAPDPLRPKPPQMHERAPNEQEIATIHAEADHDHMRPRVPATVPDVERFKADMAKYETAMRKYEQAAAAAPAAAAPAKRGLGNLDEVAARIAAGKSGRAAAAPAPAAPARRAVPNFDDLAAKVAAAKTPRSRAAAPASQPKVETKPSAPPRPAPAPARTSAAAAAPARSEAQGLEARMGKLLDAIPFESLRSNRDSKHLEGLGLHLAQGTPFEGKAQELAARDRLGTRVMVGLSRMESIAKQAGMSPADAMRQHPEAVMKLLLTSSSNDLKQALGV